MIWLEDAGLGLTLWSGQFEEEITRVRLRWCDREGRVIPTGAEGRELERQRAEIEQEGKEAERQRAGVERQRAERLAEGLREMGINPEEV